MKPTEEEARQIYSTVYQLSAMHGWPYTEEGRQALVRAYCDAYPAVTDIKNAVGELLRAAETDCPTAPEVWQMARAGGFYKTQVELLREQGFHCDACDNTGRLSIKRARKRSSLVPCTCAAGTYITDNERSNLRHATLVERAKKIAEKQPFCHTCQNSAYRNTEVDETFSYSKPCDCELGKLMNRKAV